MKPGPLVTPDTLPSWLGGLVSATTDLDATSFIRQPLPASNRVRPAAVLILFGEGQDGPDVLLLRRADTLSEHPGQVAFPGGMADPGDDGPIATALREAEEEAGVRPDGVLPVAVLPELYVSVSRFLVTPVLGYWSQPNRVRPVDFAETAAVARVPISHLVDPGSRFMIRHSSGFTGPAFAAPGMLIWGFTAALLGRVLALGGWEVPWDKTDIRELEVTRRSIELG